MSLQTSVKAQLGGGVEGELYDNSPHRADPYIVKGGAATKAVGLLLANATPTADDTVTVGQITYTFKAAAVAATDVVIGANAAAAMGNLAAKIHGDATQVADAVATDELIVLTAKVAGRAGNSIALAASNEGDMDVTAFSGGQDAGDVKPKVGLGYCFTNTEGEVIPGNPNNKAFAGILITPKQYARNGLDASLEVTPNSPVSILNFGRVLVRVTNNIAPNYYAFVDNDSGTISGNASSNAQAGKTLIPNAKFILQSASANGLAILQLGD